MSQHAHQEMWVDRLIAKSRCTAAAEFAEKRLLVIWLFAYND